MSKNVYVTPSGKKLVTVIPGDGVGPEVVYSVQRIIAAAAAPIEWEECQAGASVFEQGIPSGVLPSTIESIRKTRVALKGPLETPVGYGEKSANVTLRKLFETYGNIRPAREMPGVPTLYSGRGINLVIVRENIEDLYAGIEYMQTPDVAQGIKLISRMGCEKIVRLAFEFARSEGRKSMHCATKSNIMKLTEGTLKRTFEKVAQEYPDIEAHHIIVDNCAHQLVKKPEQFSVIVTTNMNGDILSDLTSGLIGGLGFAPSANIGKKVAIFEAVHGSAPKYAGKNVINPTALIMSATMMLRHLDEFEAAESIENALHVTLASGVHTRDVIGDVGAASTTQFTDAIISNLGKSLPQWTLPERKPLHLPEMCLDLTSVADRCVIGADIFVESLLDPEELGASIAKLTSETPFTLQLISNRGTKVYPAIGAMTECVDQYRCRFLFKKTTKGLANTDIDAQIFDLVHQVATQHKWAHLEKLQRFNGERGFTKDQGED
jgi:isocitrate dehydrogenase